MTISFLQEVAGLAYSQVIIILFSIFEINALECYKLHCYNRLKIVSGLALTNYSIHNRSSRKHIHMHIKGNPEGELLMKSKYTIDLFHYKRFLKFLNNFISKNVLDCLSWKRCIVVPEQSVMVKIITFLLTWWKLDWIWNVSNASLNYCFEEMSHMYFICETMRFVIAKFFFYYQVCCFSSM